MRPNRRWPIHPAPVEGEALSSWLHRLAACYQMNVTDLITHGLGQDHHRTTTGYDQLDLDPPSALVTSLAERTGVNPDRIQEMTLAGWRPWVYDDIDPSQAGFEVYAHQFSVLRKPDRQPQRPKVPWRAWLVDRPVRRACPQCMEKPEHALLLMWQLPLMLSCPEHRCLLQPFRGDPSYRHWPTEGRESGVPSAAVIAMDSRTHQALRTGQVDLPRRRVHAAVWFRLLRTLINELSTPATYWGARSRNLRLAWTTSGYSLRAGQSRWRPYEDLRWPVQAQFLQTAAAAMNLLKEGDLSGQGHQASLFTPEADVPVASRAPTPTPTPKRRPEFDHAAAWATTWALLDEAIQDARDDPAAAQDLYNFCVYGARTPRAIEDVRNNFIDLGIPIGDHLSHNSGPRPFT